MCSAVELDIFNLSTKPLGADSGRRSVCISMCLVPVPGLAAEEVTFIVDGNGTPIYPSVLTGNVTPDKRKTIDSSPLPGWCNTFPLVEAGRSATLHAQIQLSNNIPPMTKLKFLSMLSVEELTGTGNWTVVQASSLRFSWLILAVPLYTPDCCCVRASLSVDAW
jgi:hypothetical protein